MPDDTSNDSPFASADPGFQSDAAGLVLVSTPIGNLGDMTARGLEVLRRADLVLCEDTRMSARLLTHYGITTRTAPLHEHNESARIPELVARLQAGARIALISDAGTPLVSDPGFRLVRAAIAEGISVQSAPGANAATTALVLSGLPPHPYLFMGFAAPKSAARRAGFAKLRAAERAGLSATLIFYEAPHRLAETLADMAADFGDRPAAVARELTKRFEEVRRAGLPDLAAHYATHEARGEICIVVGPAPEEAAGDFDAMLAAALQTESVREAVAAVAAATGLPRKQVYARALELKADASAATLSALPDQV
jgi:16S rRNA (cytidine1402-2'-O)-methyltransferase